MPTSVMPKGVEHLILIGYRHGLRIMPTSVMPKGVEHFKGSPLQGRDVSNAHLCDAERR